MLGLLRRRVLGLNLVTRKTSRLGNPGVRKVYICTHAPFVVIELQIHCVEMDCLLLCLIKIDSKFFVKTKSSAVEE